MKNVSRLLATIACAALVTSCGTTAKEMMAEVMKPMAAPHPNVTFDCTVEAARVLLSDDPQNVLPVSGPVANYPSFELDTGTGVLRWKQADGTSAMTERYSVVEKGTNYRNWVAVKQISFAGNSMESHLSSATNAFVRIRPWDAPGYEHDRGRFFMVTNANDTVTGHCAPSGTMTTVASLDSE